MANPDTTPWRPTHCLLAQPVRLLARSDKGFLVEHEDGSAGWVTGWLHRAVMVPVDTAERDGLHE